MSIDEPVSTRGTTGAGVWGRENPRGHRCGKCNNGTGVTNPECPNAPKRMTPFERSLAAQAWDEGAEAAASLPWSDEHIIRSPYTEVRDV